MAKYPLHVTSAQSTTQDTLCIICDALGDLVPFVQFEKREKHSWRSVTFSKPATLLKLTLLHGCFSRFLNGTNGTKSCNAPHLMNIKC